MPDVRNEVSGELRGSVVQAGSVEHISLTGSERGEQLPVPRQLPLAVRSFVGRRGDLATLDALLPGDASPDSAGAVVISAVDGAAGVGKTALAVHWAHRVQQHFPDGTLYVNLRGYGPGEPATPGDVLGGFLGALGVSPERIPAGEEARAGMFRSVLADRHVLIVLDNANGAEQVRPLLPGVAGCMVLVTSRADPAGLVIREGAVRVTLDLLTEPEAIELVRAILGSRRADAEPEAVTALVRACARLPLALRIAAGRAVTNPYLTIAELVAELDSEQGRWAALSAPADEHTAVRTVFDWSYHRLSDDQARMLRRLGLHPGPEIGLQSAAAVAGLDMADARRLLETLVAGHLIQPVARDRYRFHDLLRAYAADRADQDDSPADRDRARRALLEWYAHHAKTAYQTIFPGNAGWHAGASLDTHASPEITFSGPAEAWAWGGRELVNVVAMVRAAAHHGFPQFAALMAHISAGALYLQGLWDDAFDVCRLGLAAARSTGDRRAECFLLESLGTAHYYTLTRWQEAADVFRAALALARDLGDPGLQATMLSHLGFVHVEQQRYATARALLQSALPLSAGVQRGRLESYIEYGLSTVHTGLDDHGQALRHAERSLALLRRSNHPDVEAYALHAMARARQGAGAHHEAITLCEQALSAIEPYPDARTRALIRDTLGTSLHRTGDTTKAIGCWRQAVAILEERGDDRAGDLRDRLRVLERAT